MTTEQFQAAYRAFCRRRPFRGFVIEFNSGESAAIGHPEAVREEGSFFAVRRPDGGHEVFAADSVTRLKDAPTPPTK